MKSRKQVHKDFYERHKEKRLAEAKARKRATREWLNTYKKSLACERCGENHFACLDFHHKDPNTKDIEIAYVVKKGWSRERILAEIKKCEVLCSNCHRKHHAAES